MTSNGRKLVLGWGEIMLRQLVVLGGAEAHLHLNLGLLVGTPVHWETRLGPIHVGHSEISPNLVEAEST